MWRIGGGYGPNWTSAGKRGASSDASVVTPPNSSANSRNAVSTQVCQPCFFELVVSGTVRPCIEKSDTLAPSKLNQAESWATGIPIGEEGSGCLGRVFDAAEPPMWGI